jgi:hypothetical protein
MSSNLLTSALADIADHVGRSQRAERNLGIDFNLGADGVEQRCYALVHRGTAVHVGNNV